MLRALVTCLTLALAGLLLAACASVSIPGPTTDAARCTRPPLTAIRLERWRLSVQPPPSDWCMGERRPNSVRFYKDLLGRRASRNLLTLAERLHTVYLEVEVVGGGLPAEAIKDDALLPLGEMIRQRNRSATQQLPRFTEIGSLVVRETWPQRECVRYERVAEERDNPMAPGAVLILTDKRWICRYPLAPRLVDVLYSERHLQGEVGLWEALKPEVEVFFEGLTFV